MTTRKKLKVTVSNIGGDEITRLLKRTYEGDQTEVWRWFAELHASDGFESFITELVSACDAVLMSNGWPKSDSSLLFSKSGNWQEWTPESKVQWNRKLHRRVVRTTKFVKEESTPFSPIWYAADIAEKCHAVKSPTEPDSSVRSLRLIALGMQLQDWSWRSREKQAIVTGRKQRRYLAQTRDSSNRNRQNNVEIRRRLVAKIANQSSRSKGALAEYVREVLATEHNCDVALRTVRRDLKATIEVRS